MPAPPSPAAGPLVLAAVCLSLALPGGAAAQNRDRSFLDDRLSARDQEMRGRPQDPYERLYGTERRGTDPGSAPLSQPTAGPDPLAAPFPTLRALATPELGAAEASVAPYCRPADRPDARRLCLTPEGTWEERD